VRLFARETEPPYYFTSHYRRRPREQALTAVAERRSLREILLEAEPAFPSAPNNGSESAAVVREFARNRVVLRAQATRPELVYSSESSFPSWRTVVNCRSAPILAANYVFRAVPVPAGDVTLALSYSPPALSAGLVVTLVAGLLLALALWPQKPASRAPFRRRTE
jgi:hypothetical protein